MSRNSETPLQECNCLINQSVIDFQHDWSSADKVASPYRGRTLDLPQSKPVFFPSRILSDWLEVKFGWDGVSDPTEERQDGALRTVCVSDTLLEEDECRVHVSVKVRGCGLNSRVGGVSGRDTNRFIYCVLDQDSMNRLQVYMCLLYQ